MNKDKNKLVMIGIIVALIVFSMGGFLIFKSAQPTSEKVWNEYVTLLEDKNYEKLYSLISSNSKKDFITRNKKYL